MRCEMYLRLKFGSDYLTILTLILIRKKKPIRTSIWLLQKIAEESVVLLKNENRTLPLSPKIKVSSIVNWLSDAPHDQLGTWTMDGETERTQTPVKALRKMYGDKVEIHFVKGLEYSRDKNKMNFNKVLAKASQVDVIIAFIGEEAILSGEAHCLADIKLQGAQSELIKILSGTNKPLITVIIVDAH